MFGLAMIKLDKRQITTLLVVSVAAILATLYYFGYIKLPAIKLPVKEKTQAELLNDFKTDLVAGKFTNINGTIAKIDGKIITLALTAGGDKKEQDVALAGNVIIRRLAMPELKLSDGLTPMIETFITAADLRVGDNAFASIKDGAAIVIDILPGLPSSGAATATETRSAGTTTDQSMLDKLLSLKQKAFALMTAGKTTQIFGTITGIEHDILTVQASTTTYRLQVATEGIITYHLQLTNETVITDLKEDPVTRKMAESFISLADLSVGDFAIMSTDKDAKTAALIIRQKPIQQK